MENQNTMIQSNSIRDNFMQKIVYRTINEIHDCMQVVFGPFAADAYIIREDNRSYYTRDGKEVLNSLCFNNPVSNLIKDMMMQAVNDQAKFIGDGTTTLPMLYTNIFRSFNGVTGKAAKVIGSYPLTTVRSVWKNIICKDMNDELAKIASKELSKDDIASLIYTCTKDPELTKILATQIPDKIEDGTLMTVNRAEHNNEVSINVYDQPLLKAECIMSLFSYEKQTSFDGSVLFVNGALDIAHPETLDVLANAHLSDSKSNIAIICSGMTDVAKKTFRTYLTAIRKMEKEKGLRAEDVLNNILIFRIQDLKLYSPDMIEDLVAYVYDEIGTPGFTQSITFESLIWQLLKRPDDPSIEELESFQFDTKAFGLVGAALQDVNKIEISELKGVRLFKPRGEISQQRYDQLRQEIDQEKSMSKKNSLITRLKSLYGKFVEVNVGAKLLADNQRKYELALDAVLATINAMKYGAIRSNSLCAALQCAYNIKKNKYSADSLEIELSDVLFTAIAKTIYDMIANMDPVYLENYMSIGYKEFLYKLLDPHCSQDLVRTCDLQHFNLTCRNVKDDKLVTTSGLKSLFSVENEPEPIIIEDFTINPVIIEPLPVMTAMLDKSFIAIELAMAKMFNVSQFIGNYI